MLFSFFRVSPYEKGFNSSSSGCKSDEKGSRLAKPDPIYETLFSGANGRLARTVGTQVVPNDTAGHEATSASEKSEEDMTFTLLNSFWFMIASLLQQGTDLLPRWLLCSKSIQSIYEPPILVQSLMQYIKMQFWETFGSSKLGTFWPA